MNLFKLFDSAYLFDVKPGFEFAYFWPLFVFFVLVFASSFKLDEHLHHRPNKKVVLEFFGGVPSRMREFAVIGLVLTFFRDQNMPYLAMRVWLVLLFLLVLLYGVYLWKAYEKGFEEKLNTKRVTKEADKYLPQSKKKRKKKRRR